MLVRLAARLPYDTLATTLVPLKYAIEEAPEASGCRFVLSLEGRDEPVFSKELPPTKRHTIDLSLTSHLLPDGEITLHASVLTPEGAEADRHSMRLEVYNPGTLAEAVRASLIRSGKPIVTDKPCDCTDYDYGDSSLLPWYERPNALEHIDARLQAGEIDATTADHLRHFVINGYIQMDSFLEPELLEEVGKQMETAVAEEYQGYKWGTSQRLTLLHQQPGGINKLWRHPGIDRMLRHIFESAPRSCQTLTYVFGSQQDSHQDSIHLTPFPAGYMCGVWVAIDDVLPDSGELIVYPGSHRMPRVTMHNAGCAKVAGGNWSEFGGKVVTRWKEMVAQSGIVPVVYRPKAGSVLIWHENLMHAGSKRQNKELSRRSVVSHVFADGALAFYDSSGSTGYMHPTKG